MVVQELQQAGARTNLGLGSLSTASTITSSEITDGTIAADDLAADAVTTVKIADNSVTLAKLSNSACAAIEVLKHNGTAWNVSLNH